MNDRKILIVDFDEDSLSSLSGLVNEEGFQAETATDGLSGYEKFRAEDYDLVILEPMLPKLHGFELCKKISQDPVKKTPIIIVTGIYREPSCKKEALQVYGASAFFTKPWNKDDLRAKMLQLLVDKKETTASREEPPAAPARSAGQHLGEAKTAHAKPKESRTDKNIDDIEKELREVVSDLIHPPKKKVVKETQQKKDTKQNIESEIDAMLKGAIGGLGLEAKKPKPKPREQEFMTAPEPREVVVEPPAKPAPAPKPIPPPIPPIATDIWPELGDNIPIAREIRENIPIPDKRPKNNLPPPSAKAHVEAQPMPFGIDQTLIEIDKIPLDVEKEPKELDRTFVESKRVYFDEYTEPQKKKPTFLVIVGLVATIVVATSATYIVLKSKRQSEPPREMVSSLQPSLPDEFSLRQSEVSTPPVTQKPAAKPEIKRIVEQTSESQPAEYIPPLQPEIPVTDAATVRLQVEPLSSSQTVSQESEPPAPKPKETVVSPPASSPQTTQAKTPAAVKEGDLVPLEQAEIPPTVVRRVEPRYPPLALNMGLSGTVTVNTLISETGDVIRTEILQGIKGGYGFERAAEAAIRQWKFTPARKNNVKVRVWKPIDIIFKLSQIPTKE
jgi:TonB family protein